MIEAPDQDDLHEDAAQTSAEPTAQRPRSNREREDRLASALRANLAKRKAQSQARSAGKDGRSQD